MNNDTKLKKLLEHFVIEEIRDIRCIPIETKEIKSCYECGVWDSDREYCTMPSSDRWYACPIHSLPEEELEKNI